MNTLAYFERIGLAPDQALKLDFEFLKLLHYQHFTSVPYENLDILNGTPISLKVDDIYNKVVTRRRGGYCFELNCLFCALLNQLGFSTVNFLARFLLNESDVPIRRHRVIGVKLEGKTYICDVGTGRQAPRYPLELTENLVQEQFGETYKFVKEDFLGWVLLELHKGEWQKVYSFTEEPQHEVDFIPPSFYCEKHPASPFNKTMIISLKTKTGRKTINDKEYKEFQGDEVVLIKPDLSDEELNRILKDEFSIQFTK